MWTCHNGQVRAVKSEEAERQRKKEGREEVLGCKDGVCTARGDQDRPGTDGAKTVTEGDALIEPDDSIEVQVVSGLIQHQQRGLHEQRPGGWGGRMQDQG